MNKHFLITPREATRFFDSLNDTYPDCTGGQADAVDFAMRDVNRLVGKIAERVARKSPYADTIEGGTLENVSESVRSVVQEQAMPAASMIAPGFVPLLEACGTIGAVDEVGSTEFIYTPLNYRGRGPKICVKTTRTAFADAYPKAVNSLKRNIVLLTNADIRANYLFNGGCKLVCGNSNDNAFSDCFRGEINALQQPWPNVTPDSPLSFTGLSYLGRYMREVLDVEPFDNPATDNGMLKYVGSADSIENFREELGIRADVQALTTGRYAMGQKTIQGYTFEGPYHGLAFGIDPHPLRADGFTTEEVTYMGETFNVLVPNFIEPWIRKQVTNGYGARPNPAWVDAPYEVGFLFGRESFKRLVPAAYGRVAGWDFAPQITNGGLVFKQLIDAECNALGDYGQHFYEIERAFQPMQPHAVCAIMMARCAGVLDFTACDSLMQYS